MSDNHQQSSTAGQGLEAKYSCVVCHRRKVKCDRNRPCSNCARNGNVECEYRAPPAPRRKKKRGVDPALSERLRRYEEALKKSGIKIDEQEELHDSDDEEPENEEPMQLQSHSRTQTHPTHPMNPEEGTLVSDAGKSRYLESSLWVTLSDQLPNSKPLLQDQPENATDDDSSQSNSQPMSILFGKHHAGDPIELFPKPEHVMILWRNFLNNVDPIIKMIHGPSAEKIVQLSCQNVHSLSRVNLSLLFSIFLAAVSSMSDEDVESKLGQTRSSLYRKYAVACEKCFVRGGLLRTTDLAMLIAFMHYLFATRQLGDPQVIWTLVGIAFRIGQRIGLHKDHDVGLRPFDKEIRRRVWLQIIILDWSSSELAGTSSMVALNPSFVMVDNPKNINDNDIQPNMKEDPTERVGATDMIFCMLRTEFATFFHLVRSTAGKDPHKHELSLAEQDRIVDELEKRIEQRFLRYCDPINPLHVMVTVVSRAALSSMRLRLHHPSRAQAGGQELDPHEKNLLFRFSLKGLQYDNLILNTPSLRGFFWHTKDYFQFPAIVYLLTLVRSMRVGEEVELVWEELVKTFQNRPELFERKKGLHVAIGMLTCQAWDAREAELIRLGLPVQVPEFVKKLRSMDPGLSRRRDPANPTRSTGAPPTSNPKPPMQQPQPEIGIQNGFPSYQALPPLDLTAGWEPNNINWGGWEQLMFNPDIPINSDFAFNALDGYFMPMQS